MNTNKDDPNLPLSHKLSSMRASAPEAQLKAQGAAANEIVDGTPKITQWQQASVNVDDAKVSKNGRQPVKVRQTSPLKMFVKVSRIPKPADLKAIKVNM
jgi:hypothetical protein